MSGLCLACVRKTCYTCLGNLDTPCMHVQTAQTSVHTPTDCDHGMQPLTYTKAKFGDTADNTKQALEMVAHSCAQQHQAANSGAGPPWAGSSGVGAGPSGSGAGPLGPSGTPQTSGQHGGPWQRPPRRGRQPGQSAAAPSPQQAEDMPAADQVSSLSTKRALCFVSHMLSCPKPCAA